MQVDLKPAMFFRSHRGTEPIVSPFIFETKEKHMARPDWKRPGSPIGKKGPRKANPIYKRRSRELWSDEDVHQLRKLAKANTPTGVIGLKLERPQAAIRSKAQREGISLGPTNRSPYNRRAKPAKRKR